MTASLHMIFKQQFHLRFIGGEIAVHTLSAALSRWQRDVLLPGMQQVLDELDVPDYHLRLSGLEINAGEIVGADWEQQLAGKICGELRKEIMRKGEWFGAREQWKEEMRKSDMSMQKEEMWVKREIRRNEVVASDTNKDESEKENLKKDKIGKEKNPKDDISKNNEIRNQEIGKEEIHKEEIRTNRIRTDEIKKNESQTGRKKIQEQHNINKKNEYWRNDIKKDETEKEDLQKDKVNNEKEISEERFRTDKISKENEKRNEDRKKDEMKKDEIREDEISKDGVTKNEIRKENTTGKEESSSSNKYSQPEDDIIQPDTEFSRFSEAEQLQLVMHYLQTGTLPWYAAVLPGKNILTWLNKLITAGYLYSEEGIAFITEHPVALQRLLIQVNPAILKVAFQQWNAKAFQQYFPEIEKIAARLFNSTDAHVWANAVLYDLIANTTKSMAIPLWKQWLNDENEAINNVFVCYKNGTVATSSSPEIKEKVFPIILKDEEHTTNGLFINNAGLVLLHPFISPWLTELGLLQEDRWKDLAAHRRAVQLLYYLSTNNLTSADYELPLCKLLLGFELNEPVAAVLDITEKEQEESIQLLQEVIRQWPILKDTSPESLQETFLQRDGKLIHQQDKWQLTVAQSPYDMLLLHMPWGFGVIRSSLMKELLFVDWA